MNGEKETINLLFEFLVELLEIPPAHYRKATDRYKSLGDWFLRGESKVALLSPEVYSQGSFRYGTVIRPLFSAEEYDLDLVVQIQMSKAKVTQVQLKQLVGDEITAYAEAHSFKEPAKEKPRCWRLNYADEVSFHMDILPCLPEDKVFVDLLVQSGISIRFATTAVAITDKRHPKYAVIDSNWPSSNPRGIAVWFEDRMRPIARSRVLKLVEDRFYASVDEVPTYEWKTPLQRSIQILKRHRDVMFRDSPGWKPLSMIITTLAAHSYGGEADLYDALLNIVDAMPKYVRSLPPRIPNPVNPAEDFADRWAKDPRYEQNFWAWHTQAKADLSDIRRLTGMAPEITRAVRKSFALDLTAEMEKSIGFVGADSGPRILKPTPTVHIGSAPKPWRKDG